MSEKQIHTCSYYCTRPECIRTQRDELRDSLHAPARPIEPEPQHCVVCRAAISEADSGLCDRHKYDEQLAPQPTESELRERFEALLREKGENENHFRRDYFPNQDQYRNFVIQDKWRWCQIGYRLAHRGRA